MAELWFNDGMLKSKAIELLGGTTAAAAEALGITYQAVDKWPPVLPVRIGDRVIATLVRQKKRIPRELLTMAEAKAA